MIASPWTPRWWLVAAALLGATFAAAPAALAQQVGLRTLEDRHDGRVVEVTAAWQLPLQAALDSAGVQALSAGALSAVTGGIFDAAEAYELPALVLPRLTVLAADYDEVALPLASGADEVLAWLDGEVVEMTGLGLSRRKPVATLVARLVDYDAARGVLRRYRRLVVALDYGTSASMSLRATGAAARTADDNPHLAVTRSVLADGVVYKIPVTREGIYRIDRDFLAGLPGLGRSPDTIDPAHVHVYGNGGAPLPALVDAPRPADLVLNPVFVQGGGDGSFGPNDYVLFYGAAPRGWRYDAENGAWTHYVNPFSNENYYFLKIADTPGASVGDPVFPGYADARPVSRVTGRYVRDMEEFIWSKEFGSGLDWMSKTISASGDPALSGGGRRPILENVALPGLAGGEVQYQARVAIRSNPVETVHFVSGTALVGQARALRSVNNDSEHPSAVPGEYSFSQTVEAGARLNLTMQFPAQARAGSEAALDWLRVFYPQDLRASGDTLRFTTPAGEAGRFDLSLAGFTREPQVWDVTEPGAIRRLGVRAEGGTFRVQVEVTDAARPRELIAFAESVAQRPVASTVQRVEAQNLHGLGTYPDFVIVTPAAFRAAADELAEYRRQQGLDVLVVDYAHVVNEFGGGLRDMRALRDYFKFLYDRAPDDASLFRYALLFGDGHFNYRNLGDASTQQATFENWIPPYETDESLDPRVTYTSDDYFGLLDDGEGIWDWGGAPQNASIVSDEHVDIGIGRFPVQTAEEAAAIVRKIKHYESPATYGAWRTRYTFIADDHRSGLAAAVETIPDLHTQNADVVAEMVRQMYPVFDVKKIYGVSYDRVQLGGWRLPGVERDIQAALNSGTLLMNYSGHGGEEALAQEAILTREDAMAFDNFDRLAIFVTATCSFGWWDLGREQSAAELLLLNPNGGAIALMTTVRLVYTHVSTEVLNVGLNRYLNMELFKRDEDGLPRRLGDVMRLTKRTRAGREGNNRKFNLLGDPTMRVGLPPGQVAVETVNGQPLAEQPQLRALDRVTVAGAVRTPDGAVDTGFDGQVHVTVFDAERRVTIPIPTPSMADYYTVREDLIWRGTVPAAAGRFEATFVVPKDISYSDRPGRISVYAAAADGRHGAGFTEAVRVGGTADNPVPDASGPEIALFLNDTTFVSGGLTPPDPRLIVRLADESGINAVGAGVGHELLLVVDGDEQNAVNLSDKFESEPGSYRRGQVVFPFNEYPNRLSEGPHTATVRAWDVANNSSTATVEFYVSAAEDLVLRNVFNYPNPTSGHTRFIFEHNQPAGTLADVQVRIYTLTGRPVRTLDAAEALPGGVLTSGPVQVEWDGRDEDLDPVATGVYLYKVRVAVDGADGERHVSEKIEKLAVIR